MTVPFSRKPVAMAAAVAWLMLSPPAGAVFQRSPEGDLRAVEAVERQWLASEHDRVVLERVLADDFVHPVAAGLFLTKAEHIDWAVRHPLPAGQQRRFDQLRVRTYGDVGIANGVVVSTAADGRVDRTVFTDVFVLRDGRWQAVNAQENAVQPVPAR